MKKFLKITVVWLVILGLLPISSYLRAMDPQVETLEKSNLPKLHIPPIQEKVLPSGLRLYFLRDTDFPLVRGYFYIRTGSIYEPDGKTGLASLTAELLRAGGTKREPPEQFNDRLASLGAQIESGANRDVGFVAFQCLKEDFPEVLEMVFEMLREPRFDEQKFQILKWQMQEALRRQNDQPTEIARREFPKLVYPKDSVYSRTPTPHSVKAITLQDIQKFYREFYHPDRMILALSGDVKAKEAVKLIKKGTQGWAKSTQPLPQIAPLQKTWESGVYLVKKDTDQSTLVLGHYGEKRFNQDKFALLLLNDILGGEVLMSRLGKRIRSTLGLAYGVFSQFGFQDDYGLFFVFAQTKGPSTGLVLQEIRKILTEVAKGETLTEQELATHKRSVLNSLFSQYEPRFNFVKEEARFAYYGYPPNYLETFRKKIAKVTLQEVRAAAKQYLRPDALKVLIVGDPKKTGALPGAEELELDLN